VATWDTPDSIAGSDRCYLLPIPDDEYSQAVVSGALQRLSLAENWEQAGTLTPEEAADRFGEAFDEFMQWRQCMQPGVMFFWPGEDAPDYGLLCDGSEVAKADYPALYDVIGDSWGTPGSGDNFVLPDAEGMFLLAAGGGYAVGDTGGEETHTLSVDEIPAHQHTEVSAGYTEGLIGEIPAPVTAPGATSTGSAGGGGSHNNMPPYLAVPLYIAF
jgi:microcystin-dependent protein